MRVLHAPANIANQVTMLARGLRECGLDVFTCEAQATWPEYPVDLCLHLDAARTRMQRRLWQMRFFLWAAARFDVFHFHYCGSLLSRNRDLICLKRLRRRLFMHFWGDDVRPPDSDPTARAERHRVRRVQRIAPHVGTALVADGELRSYVEPYFHSITTVRQAIDIAAFPATPPRPDVRVPVVVHAPSERAKKGTASILAAVEQLRARHAFEWVLVEHLPHREAVETYRRADIVIDQIALGTHGLFAVEAMALAKPVICRIDSQWRSGYPSELPLVSATADTLADALAELLSSGASRCALGEAGRAYVERYHDARIIAEALCPLYTGVARYDA